MSFPRYPKYKPSGVEWLGEVPEHWRASRLGFLGASGMGQTILREDVADEPSEGALPVFSASEGDQVFGYLVNPQVVLQPGDIVIGARGSIGLARRMRSNATCTQTTIWFKPSPCEVESVYLQWVMSGCKEQLFPYDKTAVPMLTVAQVRSGRVPIPPASEQRAIAAFLDRETAKIDALVAEQERLIELLAEKRQAVISDVVTKGLDPAAPMKPSGVEWLGDVPAHWDVIALRHLIDCLDGRRIPLNAEERAARTGDVPYWGANCVVDYVDKALLEEPVVLLGEDGAPFFDKPKPVAFHVKVPIWPNNHVHVLRPLERIEGTYLAHALNVTDYAAFIQGSTRDKLTQGAMNAIPIPIPPRSEQAAIADRLAKHEGQSAGLTALAIRAVELLKERRSALISAAVTGQIDVRNAVPESAA